MSLITLQSYNAFSYERDDDYGKFYIRSEYTFDWEAADRKSGIIFQDRVPGHNVGLSIGSLSKTSNNNEVSRELQIQYVETEFNLNNQKKDKIPTLIGVDVRRFRVLLNGYYNISVIDKLMIYCGAGAGIVKEISNYGLAMQSMVGLYLRSTENFNIYGGYRYSYEYANHQKVNSYESKKGFHYRGISFGVSFLF